MTTRVLFIGVMVMLLIAYAISFSSLYSEREERVKERMEKCEKVDTFLYKGHTMLRFTNEHDITVCHSPECSKCRLFYD